MNKKISRSVWIAWIAIMVAGIALLFIGITKESLWYDESYSAAIVNHSFWEIITISGADSHPPLYFLMLRLFSMIFGHSVLALRAFSLLGVVCLAALGMGPVRRALGTRYALIFTFLTFVLPISYSMAHETRMYTWSAFFVTAAMLFGYLAIRDNQKKDWALLGVFSLCAMYTHYYSLLAVMMLGALLLLMMLIEKKKLKPFLITAGALVVGYIPWIFNLLSQANRVSGSYWIPKVEWYVINNTLIYPFSNKFSSPWSAKVVQIAFIVSAVLILVGIVSRLIKKDERVRVPLLAIGVYVLTIGAAVAASYIIRPVLVERYMMSVLGMFILALTFGIGSLGKKVLPILGCVVILAFAVPQTYYTMQHRFNGPMTEAYEAINEKIGSDDVFLHTDEHTLGTFCYYFPNNSHYYYQKEGTGGYSNYDAFLPTGVMIESLDEIETTGKVWLIQRYGGTDTASAGEWMKSKQIILAGTPKSYSVDLSWYSFMVYPGNSREIIEFKKAPSIFFAGAFFIILF